MKALIIIAVCIASSASLHSQTWISKTIGGNWGFTVSPVKQFVIDPYRNSMWFVLGGKASVIESDGSYRIFEKVELESVFTGENLFFAFTPNHIYYKVDLVGLKTFDNYSPLDVYADTDLNNLLTDNDSVFYIESNTNKIFKISDFNTTENTLISCASAFRRKHGITYMGSGSIFYSNGPGNPGTYLYNDPEYLFCAMSDFEFSRNTDTLYIAQLLGISYAYKENVLGNFTPSNTTNMPSPDVRLLEFDMNDNLWAGFADANGDLFALAMLDGTNWTNIYDATNSPIDFSEFRGFQFDTLNNIWVAEMHKLHTIENQNSPQWLSTLELDQFTFNMYPNPSEGIIHISLPENVSASAIEILDFSGKLVAELPFQTEIEIEQAGIYFIRIVTESGVLGIQKVVVR